MAGHLVSTPQRELYLARLERETARRAALGVPELGWWLGFLRAVGMPRSVVTRLREVGQRG